jgi:hypothetical protein
MSPLPTTGLVETPVQAGMKRLTGSIFILATLAIAFWGWVTATISFIVLQTSISFSIPGIPGLTLFLSLGLIAVIALLTMDGKLHPGHYTQTILIGCLIDWILLVQVSDLTHRVIHLPPLSFSFYLMGNILLLISLTSWLLYLSASPKSLLVQLLERFDSAYVQEARRAERNQFRASPPPPQLPEAAPISPLAMPNQSFGLFGSNPNSSRTSIIPPPPEMPQHYFDKDSSTVVSHSNRIPPKPVVPASIPTSMNMNESMVRPSNGRLPTHPSVPISMESSPVKEPSSFTAPAVPISMDTKSTKEVKSNSPTAVNASSASPPNEIILSSPAISQPRLVAGDSPAPSLLSPKLNGSSIYKYKARALYAYTASPDDPLELSFAKDEILEIANPQGNRWWQAKNASGAMGIAPSNYLQLLPDGNSA